MVRSYESKKAIAQVSSEKVYKLRLFNKTGVGWCYATKLQRTRVKRSKGSKGFALAIIFCGYGMRLERVS